MAQPTGCYCGHSFTDHWRGVQEAIYKCNKCQCSAFTRSSILQNNGESIDNTEERLRDVLRTKYQEFCPECNWHLGVADISWDMTKSKFSCQVTCQNCFKLLIDISINHRMKTSRILNYNNNINSVIEMLCNFSEANKVR